MNDINNLPKEMPDTTSTFQIDLVGSVTKKRFLGEFTCKIPTLKDQGLIARHEAALNGEMGAFLPSGIQKLHKMMAYLRFTLIDVPKFWRESDLGYELRDFNVVEAIYNEVMAFEEKWYLQIWGEAQNESDEEKEE